MVFHIFGCRISITFSFVLMISFSMLTGTRQLFWVLLFASLHEIGHLIFLLLYGGMPDSITFSYYGVGLTHSVPMNRGREALFLCGGIAVNAFFYILRIHREINAVLFLINALPLYPLDMGRVLALYLPDKICRAVSTVFLLLLFAAAAFFKNISLLLIGVYIIVFSLKEELR